MLRWKAWPGGRTSRQVSSAIATAAWSAGSASGRASDYKRLASSKILAPVDDTPVWSIVCFVVSRRARGQGVATELLAAAIDYARDHGATMLEAYPVDTTDGRVPAANAYHGPLPMFERAGFHVVERRQWNAKTPIRPIVRLALDRR